MARRHNPYDWQSHHPKIEIPQPEVDGVSGILSEGGSAIVLGGRGMGKSVFLHQLRKALERAGGTRVVLIAAPPPELTIRACLDQLASHLEVPLGALNVQACMDAYFGRGDVPERLVLLFDEFDRYAQRGEPTTKEPGRGFFNDLEAARRDTRGLGILATGSLGVFVVRDVLGSSFLSRAFHTQLTPFQPSQIEVLVQPFAMEGRPLTAETGDALFLASGGIPALLTYGLQQLWRLGRAADERDVLDAFAQFRLGHAEYLRDVLRSVADPRLSEAPLRVLERIRRAAAPLPRSELASALAPNRAPLDLDLVDVLRLLVAAGLVRVDGSLHTDDPVRARPISSLLDLPTSSAPVDALAERLRRDLENLLAKLHRASADFFRPVRGGDKRLVPESVFAAHLGLGLELLGWRTEREAQSAAGRTDLKLRRNGAEDVLLVEVKIWGRNDYREAQRQLERYWTADVRFGVVIQLTDSEPPNWAERYGRECLAPLDVPYELDGSAPPPIHAHFRTTSASSAGTMPIDHYCVTLPRRS